MGSTGKSVVMRKNINRIILFLGICLIFAICSGCEKREAPEAFLKKEIEKASQSKNDVCSVLLKEQIAEDEISDFPDELTEGYISFLRTAYSHIQFTVKEVTQESRNSYKGQVEVEPLDLGETVETINNEYLKNIQSDNLATVVKELMVLDQDQLAQSIYLDPLTVHIRFTWDDDNDCYTVNESDYKELLKTAVVDRLSVYYDAEEIFDIRDYVTACLDASFKGEFEEYMNQTGYSREEAEAEYESAFWDSEMDSAGFSEEEKSTLISSMKEIAAASDYQTGVPQRQGEKEFTVKVSGTQNLSFQKALEEINQAVNNGEIQDEAAMRTYFVEVFQKYGRSPVSGDPFEVTVHVTEDDNHKLAIKEEDSKALADTVLPQ